MTSRELDDRLALTRAGEGRPAKIYVENTESGRIDTEELRAFR